MNVGRLVNSIESRRENKAEKKYGKRNPKINVKNTFKPASYPNKCN